MEYDQDKPYAADYEKVLGAIRTVLQADPSQLMRSLEELRRSQDETTAAINALRREVMQQTRLLAGAA